MHFGYISVYFVKAKAFMVRKKHRNKSPEITMFYSSKSHRIKVKNQQYSPVINNDPLLLAFQLANEPS